ncbi:MAG: hypothetical protein ACRC2U_19530 [Aeromonas sp.]
MALECSLGEWQSSLHRDSARLREYQRELAACRRLSPRPKATVRLTLRQCIAARRLRDHAGMVLSDLYRKMQPMQPIQDVRHR